MNLFLGHRRRASFDVNQRPSSFKVFYLGNVATSLTRGDGCADRPAKLLWDMHVKNQGRLGRKLRLTISNAGLQAESVENADLTSYCTNRIAYHLVANKLNPKMFVWVYRHVNVRSGLTTEVRPECSSRSLTCLSVRLSLRSSCDVTDVSARVKTRRNRWSIYFINIYKTR